VEADDIVQEVFLDATSAVSKLEARSPATIMLWLAAIAENAIRKKVEFFQAQKREAKREVRLDLDSASSLAGSRRPRVPSLEPSPSEKVARAESAAKFAETYDSCVKDLKPEWREVLLLRDYCEEQDWETIRLRIRSPSIEAVKQLHFRARQALKACLRSRGL
jgi:DNA-directed RNA polymerase specialized sigma24 family protein